MEQRYIDYLVTRARPGEEKIVTYHQIDFKDKAPDGSESHVIKNHGLPAGGKVTLKVGYCPCSICGHTIMLDCEEQDCQCCSSTCT